LQVAFKLLISSREEFYQLRNRNYQPVSQIDIEESKCSIDENTSCLVDENSVENNKSSLVDRIDNVNIKQIDEILPLMNDKSFNLKMIVPPVVSYYNFLLQCNDRFSL
jgi:hypothetical protein